MNMLFYAGAVGVAVGYGLNYLLSSSKSSGFDGIPTLGYWKIRGLAAACRMMLCYKGQKFQNKSYGDDYKTSWFGGDKPKLGETNGMINLPYIKDGSTVVTQSNSCLLYLGKKLGIDKVSCEVHNHQVLDETMDLRNNLMKIVYPFSGCKKEDYAATFKKHVEGDLVTSLTKLENSCKGRYMCGDHIQSCDFHVFEMLDQHIMMMAEGGLDFDWKKFPKLFALRNTIKADPALATYFKSDAYCKYAVNNPGFTHFNGAGYGDGPFGPTTSDMM